MGLTPFMTHLPLPLSAFKVGQSHRPEAHGGRALTPQLTVLRIPHLRHLGHNEVYSDKARRIPIKRMPLALRTTADIPTKAVYLGLLVATSGYPRRRLQPVDVLWAGPAGMPNVGRRWIMTMSAVLIREISRNLFFSFSHLLSLGWMLRPHTNNYDLVIDIL